MVTLRKELTAGQTTAFNFSRYESASIIVKNGTDGDLFFCDGAYSDSAAVRIPARGWQSFMPRIAPGESPLFSVKSDKAGFAEISFGSANAGTFDVAHLLDIAGLLQHVILLDAAADTTLTAALIRKHGDYTDLASSVALTNGNTIYHGDVIEPTAACSAVGKHAVLTVNGIVQTLDGSGKCTITATGDVDAAVTAESD